MSKETKTVSLSLDSAQLAILEDALYDLKVHFNSAPQPVAWDTHHREWEYSADYDAINAVAEAHDVAVVAYVAADVDALRCIVASARESASVRSMKGKLL